MRRRSVDGLVEDPGPVVRARLALLPGRLVGTRPLYFRLGDCREQPTRDEGRRWNADDHPDHQNCALTHSPPSVTVQTFV